MTNDGLHDSADPRACAPYGRIVGVDRTAVERLARAAGRAVERRDPHGRLRAGVLVTERNHHRAIRIAFEAARLVTLPTRATPRIYTRKGVRYAVFAEDGVIWVVQEVPEAAREVASSAPPDEA